MSPGAWRRLRLAVCVAATVGVLAGCSRDPQAAYCETVEDQQETLSEIAASEDPSSLLDALPAYRELAEDAPRDVAGDWAQVVEALEGLESVLDDAGVDPDEYDAEEPPTDLSAEDRDAIESAAKELGSQDTVASMGRVEQHALDVCGTPLSR